MFEFVTSCDFDRKLLTIDGDEKHSSLSVFFYIIGGYDGCSNFGASITAFGLCKLSDASISSDCCDDCEAS